MEKQPQPQLLSIPMTAIEREHYMLMYNNITRIRDEVLIDKYIDTVFKLNDPEGYTAEEYQQLTDILNILYCELVERGVEFKYDGA